MMPAVHHCKDSGVRGSRRSPWDMKWLLCWEGRGTLWGAGSQLLVETKRVVPLIVIIYPFWPWKHCYQQGGHSHPKGCAPWRTQQNSNAVSSSSSSVHNLLQLPLIWIKWQQRISRSELFWLVDGCKMGRWILRDIQQEILGSHFLLFVYRCVQYFWHLIWYQVSETD